MKTAVMVKVVNPEIKRAQVEFIQGRKGLYRAIVKTKGGLTVVDDLGIAGNWGKKQWNSARDVFRGFKRGALQTIEFKADNVRGGSWLTVFARSGNKIKLIDNDLLASLVVGDINQDWAGTDLYSMDQYAAVNAKTWDDLAYAMN